MAFLVGFTLTVSAPLVNDYDFRLKTESMASIVAGESGVIDAGRCITEHRLQLIGT